MQVIVKPGKYILAVSGGVDSMVLLDILAGRADIELVVAHYDHGIREDSAEDRMIVERAALSYGVPFTYEEGRLGPKASEARARSARYGFLERIQQVNNAQAIITAHHQDDVLETAIVNLLRGTGRRGMTSLVSSERIVRPLLKVTKQDIKTYAQSRQLRWREDSTNSDEKYLRNYIRRKILTRFGNTDRDRLLGIIERVGVLNEQIDTNLQILLQIQQDMKQIDRSLFIMLPHNIAREMLAYWLRQNAIKDFDTKSLERMTVAGKTFRPGATLDVSDGTTIRVGKHSLALVRPER